MKTISENFYNVGVEVANIKNIDGLSVPSGKSTFNSYLFKTTQYCILFDTVPCEYSGQLASNIREVCDISSITHIVLSGASPLRSGALFNILELAPSAKVLGAPETFEHLSAIYHREIVSESVFDGQTIKVDTGRIRFLIAPFVNWPDSLFTYIDGLKLLISGSAYSSHSDNTDAVSFKYYYDNMLAARAPNVAYSTEKLKAFDIAAICPAHGPVISEPSEYIRLYENWSSSATPESHAKPLVAAPCFSIYGFTAEIAEAVYKGVLTEIDADIRRFDMKTEAPEKVLAAINSADGLLFGTSTVNSDLPEPFSSLLDSIKSAPNSGKAAAVFGSCGWSSEAVDMINSKLDILGISMVRPALKIKFKADSAALAEAENFGRKFGRRLKETWQKRSAPRKMSWLCVVCGEVFDGAMPPSKCPVCGAGREAFVEYAQGMITFRKNDKLKVVIIGSGAAAVAAAEAVRTRNRKASIDIYSREKGLPYFRPVLTKGLGETLTDREYFIKPAQFYDEKRITLHPETEVRAVNPSEKKIVLSDSTEVLYDKLLFATGAKCFVPPIQGADLPEVAVLREKTDFDRLLSLLSDGPKKIVVIGGGLLGLETAYSLFRMKHKVMVLEVCPCLLPRQLDREAASVFEASMKQFDGISFNSSTMVTEIAGHGKVTGVVFQNGETVPCDIVIISAGIRSNVEIAKNAGLTVDRAIVVDDKMQTSLPDIYAAGDCASFNGRTEGIWETAVEQGKTAGANMAGDEVSFKTKISGVTLNAFGTQLFSMGENGSDPKLSYEVVSSRNEIKRTCSKILFRDGRIAGAMLVGDVSATARLIAAVTGNYDKTKAEDSGLI